MKVGVENYWRFDSIKTPLMKAKTKVLASCIETDTIEKVSCRPSSRLYFKDKFRLRLQQLRQRSDLRRLSVQFVGGGNSQKTHSGTVFHTLPRVD